MPLQFKTSEIASRCAGLIRVNVYKDSIVNGDRLPPLPGVAALTSMLEPSYEALRAKSAEVAHSKPTYNVTDAERRASIDFLTVCTGFDFHSQQDRTDRKMSNGPLSGCQAAYTIFASMSLCNVLAVMDYQKQQAEIKNHSATSEASHPILYLSYSWMPTMPFGVRRTPNCLFVWLRVQ